MKPVAPPSDLSLTLIEPPLKRLKNQLEYISNSAESVGRNINDLVNGHQNPPSNFDSQETDSLINGALSASNENCLVDNWRRSISKVDSIISKDSEFEMFSETDFKEPFTDEFDFELDELSMIDHESSALDQFSNYNSNESFHRVKVLKITESFFVKEGQKFQYPQKIVECLALQNDACLVNFAPIKALVRGDWLHCKISEDDTINLLGPVLNGEIVIDNENNYLVIEPDILINTTAVADSFSCLRRAVISYRTQPSVEDNKPNVSMVCGSIVHELVEESFRSSEFNLNEARLNELIMRNIEAIFSCDKDEKFVKEKVMEIMTNFPKWCSLYLRKVPALHAHVIDQIKCNKNANKQSSSKSQDKSICISKVLDLEENIWSVMFGLKGKVDATVLMKYRKDGGEFVEVVCPFELKTGHSTTSVAHRAQTLLYTLMLHDRHRKPIDFGLLYYISTGDLIRISGWRDEIRSILIARNRLAESLAQTDRLPEQIRNEFLCKKCFQVDSCVMYHSLSETGSVETSSVPKIFEEKTQHLQLPGEVISQKYNGFFQKWNGLITLEEAETIKTRSEIWRFDSLHRSQRGKCLRGMKIISSEKVSDYKYSSKFICDPKDYELKSVSLLNTYINEGDLVVVSGETPMQYAISTGVVGALKADMIEVFTDRNMLVLGDSKAQSEAVRGVSFCIDKNELTGSFGLLRANLLKLFSLESRKLLDFVVDLKTPRFLNRETVERSILKAHGLLEDFDSMDADQKEAFYRSIETMDYLLILGMPGTGKTTTLSFIIRYLVLVLGKSILISSHTHSALDHIGFKLQEKNLPFLRIGNEDKIDKSIDSSALLMNKKFETVSEVEHCYSTARVVICTSFGMNHSLFMRKRFDFCLVDEASQLTLPACIGALRVAQAFILVGDHYQLPPLVRSKEALKGGFGESLFKTLADSHPAAMVKLCNQYRMNDEIMLMANRLTYQNLLKCASEHISAQTLSLARKPLNEVEWIRKVMLPSCKVVFVNTDAMDECHEVKNGNSFHNEIEAKIIEQLVMAAVRDYGIEARQVSLISPYRPQLKYLNFDDKIEVSTIDKYQGRDCDCVVISLVRSNPAGNIGELLTDWQRLNVAFTRSKKKLVLVGSVRTVLNNPAFKKLKDLVDERDWLIHLPSDSISQVSKSNK